MKQKKKWMILGILFVSLVLIGVGAILTSSKSKQTKEENPHFGLWKMSHMTLADGYEVDYKDQEFSDIYYYFTKDKVTVFRLSSGKVILNQERFYRIQDGELLMSKTKDFENPREYEFTSGIQMRKITFSNDTMQIIETQENNTSTETYQKVDATLIKQLKESYENYLKELQNKVPEGN